MNLVNIIFEYFSYSFVRNAFLVGILIALCASLLGVNLVLKRLSFMGDGLSHVAFGALAVAMALGVTKNMLIVLPVTVVVAVLLLGVGNKAKVKGDAAIAMLSVGALALGYLLMHLFPSQSGNIAGDVCSTLFGSTSILTLSSRDVYISIALSAVVLILYVLFYNRLFAVTFDEDFAQATGTRVGIYRVGIAVVVAVVIVLAMELVGSLLISALIVFPTLSATRVIKNFRGVVIFSAIFGVAGAAIGMLLSIILGTPVGATVVCVDIVAFGLSSLVGAFRA